MNLRATIHSDPTVQLLDPKFLEELESDENKMTYVRHSETDHELISTKSLAAEFNENTQIIDFMRMIGRLSNALDELTQKE